MARIVVHTEKTPIEVKVGDESKWICRCGLSKKQPFCDGSHRPLATTEEEGKIYAYDANGTAVEIRSI